MRVCRIYIPNYSWNVTAFFDVSASDEEEVMEELRLIRCPEHTMARVGMNLRRDKIDTGFTYSNGVMRESVMSVGHASSPREFLNSYAHELRHLVDDIAYTSFLPMRGEGVGYLTGELSWEYWNEIRDLLCCGCHKE